MNEKRQRKFLRLSLRSLLIVPLLVGAYLACGPATKASGVNDVIAYQRTNNLHQISPQYVAPLVLKCWVSEHNASNRTTTTKTNYFVWFFGYVKLLPYERVQIEDDAPGNAR